MINDSTILDIISSKSRIIYNIYSPYLDANILFLNLYPYSSNKFAILVESFYGFYIFNIIDNTNIQNFYEINNLVKDIVKDPYYTNISNKIVEVIKTYLNRWGIIPISDSSSTINLTVFIPYDYLLDSSNINYDNIFKRYHGGLFISTPDRGTDFVIINGNLYNIVNNNFIDNNVEKIYGGIYNYDLNINNSLYYYESVVYKKYNDNNIHIYFRNSYNNINIKTSIQFFNENEYNSGDIFFSFLPTNIIIYKNKSDGGFSYYRLLNLSENFIKEYLKDKYGINYSRMNKDFYPTKKGGISGIYKLSKNPSGTEIIPTYIYTYKNYDFNICDKIFNLSYFDLTESSQKFGETSEIFKIFWNNTASKYYQVFDGESTLNFNKSIFNFYCFDQYIDDISSIDTYTLFNKVFNNKVIIDITNTNSYNIYDFILELKIPLNEISDLVNTDVNNIFLVYDNNILPYYRIIIQGNIYFYIYIKNLYTGVNTIDLLFLDPIYNIDLSKNFTSKLVDVNYMPYSNLDDTSFLNNETQLLNSSVSVARRMILYRNTSFQYDIYPLFQTNIVFPMGGVNISGFKNSVFSVLYKYTTSTSFQNNSNHFDLTSVKTFKSYKSQNLNFIDISLKIGDLLLPEDMNVILSFDRIYTSSTSINDVSMFRKNININNIMVYFSSITSTTGTLANVFPSMIIYGKGYQKYDGIYKSYKWSYLSDI